MPSVASDVARQLRSYTCGQPKRLHLSRLFVGAHVYRRAAVSEKLADGAYAAPDGRLTYKSPCAYQAAFNLRGTTLMSARLAAAYLRGRQCPGLHTRGF